MNERTWSSVFEIWLVQKHSDDSNPTISPEEVFSILLTIPPNLNKSLGFRLLRRQLPSASLSWPWIMPPVYSVYFSGGTCNWKNQTGLVRTKRLCCTPGFILVIIYSTYENHYVLPNPSPLFLNYIANLWFFIFILQSDFAHSILFLVIIVSNLTNYTLNTCFSFTSFS